MSKHTLEPDRERTVANEAGQPKVYYYKKLIGPNAVFHEQHIKIYPNDQVDWFAHIESGQNTGEKGPHIHAQFAESNDIQTGLVFFMGEFHWNAGQNGDMMLRKTVKGAYEYNVKHPSIHYTFPR